MNNIPDEPQPGCSDWNYTVKEGESGESDDREEIMELGVPISGDEIEIDLEP